MKKFLLALLFTVAAIVSPAETKQALTLHMESGARIVYLLEQQPAITFAGQAMNVTADGETSSIPMTEVARWEIGETSSTPSITTDEAVSVIIDGCNVAVHNPRCSEILIVNVEGRIVARSSDVAPRFILPRGIYLISAENKTYKIAVR